MEAVLDVGQQLNLQTVQTALHGKGPAEIAIRGGNSPVYVSQRKTQAK